MGENAVELILRCTNCDLEQANFAGSVRAAHLTVHGTVCAYSDHNQLDQIVLLSLDVC